MRKLLAAAVFAVLSGCTHEKSADAVRQFQSARPKPNFSELSPKAPAPAPAAQPPNERKRKVAAKQLVAGETYSRQSNASGLSASRSWTETGSFMRGRFGGVMQKLRDGRVLLAGGLLEGVARGLADVDLYDPATERWTSAAPLRYGRYFFAAAALADGRVMVSGGHGPSGAVINTTEIFDPLTNAWTEVAPMSLVRSGHQLVLLPDGRVLALGGSDGSADSSISGAEIYDPVGDSWSDAGTMSRGRQFPAVALLGDGKVLVSGGSGTATCDLYDPATKRWTQTGSMHAPRYYHQAGLLSDGRVLVAGGGGGPGEAFVADSAEVYDPSTGQWTPTVPLGVRRYSHAMVIIKGVPLIIGGENRSSDIDGTEYYETAANSWRPGPRLGGGRTYPLATLLDDGRVLVAGGRRGLSGGMPLASAELLSATGSFAQPYSAAAPKPAPHMPDRTVYESHRAPASLRAPASVFDVDNPENLPSSVAPRPHAHAVVIGVERYRETLPRADFAASDAKLTAEYFRRVLGVPAENLAFLSDDRATKSDFEKYFERWLPNRVEPGDEVFVYFSGHGAPNPKTGESYLVPFDADPTYIEQTGYPIKKMYEQLARLPAKRVLLVMDSCFSGAGGRSVIAKGARPLVSVVQSEVPRGLTVISASGGDQISNSYQEKRHGLFTYFFLKGLKEKGSDFRAVYDYLKPKVSRVARREYNSDQDPQWRKGK